MVQFASFVEIHKYSERSCGAPEYRIRGKDDPQIVDMLEIYVKIMLKRLG